MTDIDGLKQRIGLVDLRLQTAHSARERESASLIEMWEEMRNRYADQQDTVAELRQKISELENTRDELTALVSGLLEAVESGIERMADDSIPDIREMAGQLIGLDGAEREEETEEKRRDQDFELVLSEALAEPEDTDEPKTVPLSNEGIKQLIRRVELAAMTEREAEAELESTPWDGGNENDNEDELVSLRAELEKLRQQSLAATG